MHITHRLLLWRIRRRRRGCIRAPGVFCTRRWTHSASARAHLGHFLPLLKLFRREQGFHLCCCVVLDGFQFGSAVFRRQAGEVGILSQLPHFLHLGLHDRPEFWLLVIGQVELLGNRVEIGPASHARPTRRPAGRRSACRWRGWRSVGGILRMKRKVPRQQVAGDKRGDDQWFCNFHKLCFGRCFQTPPHQTGTAVCSVRRAGCLKVTTRATLSPLR